MGYYVRVLSPTKESPTIREICNFLKRNKIKFSIDYNDNHKEMDNKNWEQLVINYDKTKNPLILDRCLGELVEEEKTEFLEEIEDLPESKNKTKIIKKLGETKQVFAFDVPTSDITDEGWNLQENIIKFLIDKTKGIIQADGEGFYIGKELVLGG